MTSGPTSATVMPTSSSSSRRAASGSVSAPSTPPPGVNQTGTPLLGLIQRSSSARQHASTTRHRAERRGRPADTSDRLPFRSSERAHARERRRPGRGPPAAARPYGIDVAPRQRPGQLVADLQVVEPLGVTGPEPNTPRRRGLNAEETA